MGFFFSLPQPQPPPSRSLVRSQKASDGAAVPPGAPASDGFYGSFHCGAAFEMSLVKAAGGRAGGRALAAMALRVGPSMISWEESQQEEGPRGRVVAGRHQGRHSREPPRRRDLEGPRLLKMDFPPEEREREKRHKRNSLQASAYLALHSEAHVMSQWLDMREGSKKKSPPPKKKYRSTLFSKCTISFW